MSSDWREMNHKWFQQLDEGRMRVLVTKYDEETAELEEDVWIPVEMEVCSGCEGKGTCVNPSIDSNGISSEEFQEDPDFAQDYYAGVYDVCCPQCKGRRVQPAPKLEEDKKWLSEWYAGEREMQAEIDAERRMGC